MGTEDEILLKEQMTQVVREYGDSVMEKAEERFLRYFEYGHLPTHLQEFSAPFKELAHKIAREGKDWNEKMAALRKLVEAKDAAVRSLLP